MKLNSKLSKIIVALFIGAAFVTSISSCNSTEEEIKPYLTPENVAVTSFKISNKKISANLDTTFFSIDLENGVIFNADSLPAGTEINKLVTTIKYSSYATQAVIKMEGGTTRTDTVDYAKTTTDSIDYTGKVTLRLATANNSVVKEYTIKINVHKQDVDSLIWADDQKNALPARQAYPVEQKCVSYKNKAISLIQERDNSYTLASSDDLYNNKWEKQAVTLGFTPDIRSLCASDSILAILDKQGNMYESTDGLKWTATGKQWHSIIGGYNETVLGIRNNGTAFEYAQYPQRNLVVTTIDPQFPITDQSNFVTTKNRWTTTPAGLMMGGKRADGSISDCTWGFDGRVWACLAQGTIPAVKSPSIIPYYNFRHTENAWEATEYPVWMLVCGQDDNGNYNRNTYLSYDNGITWSKADEKLQLPKIIPAMSQCDNVVMTTRKSFDLANNWKKKPGMMRITSEVVGSTLYWECPYIYLVGGKRNDGALFDTIWRGALARLTYPPII